MSLIAALCNLAECSSLEIGKNEKMAPNFVSAQGKKLEDFVRDIFCGIPGQPDTFVDQNKVFSYVGAVNNPPDAMLRGGGDAIEIKKVEKKEAGIFLNSSLPKTRLSIDDKMIRTAARECEPWTSRDMLYVVGHVPKGAKFLSSLFFFYGDCFAKHNSFYQDVFKKIKENVSKVSGMHSDGNEYGTLKDVDGLGNGVNMRIRPMNSISSPWVIFGNHVRRDGGAKLLFVSIMRKGKFLSFPRSDRERLDSLGLKVDEIKIKDPNNPDILVDAVMIKHVEDDPTRFEIHKKYLN